MKIFLGGTIKNDYRERINIERPVFNPVVDDWDEWARIKEEEEKKICDVHLYYLTPDMQGFYSIAEAVESSFYPTKLTIFGYDENDERWLNWCGNNVIQSLKATAEIILRHGGIIVTGGLIALEKYINSDIIESDIKERTV